MKNLTIVFRDSKHMHLMLHNVTEWETKDYERLMYIKQKNGAVTVLATSEVLFCQETIEEE